METVISNRDDERPKMIGNNEVPWNRESSKSIKIKKSQIVEEEYLEGGEDEKQSS
jgi:hypothetical protein